jgi:hypothetical protein
MNEVKLGQFVGITLTNVRVRQRYKNMVKSALLSQINGIALVYRSNIIWVVISVLTLLAGIGLEISTKKSGGGFVVVAIIVAAIFLGIYFATRFVVLEVCAGQLIISESVKGNLMQQSVAFIDAVEQAQKQH